jgi:hypothetical protein
MNHLEVSKLLALIAAIDNRDINEVTVEMWQRIMADFDYEEMAQAVPRYFAENDAYLAPRGLISQAKRMRERVAEKESGEVLREEIGSYRSDPEPLCASHGLRITVCRDCYMRLWAYEEKHGSRGLHDWALVNVYA